MTYRPAVVVLPLLAAVLLGSCAGQNACTERGALRGVAVRVDAGMAKAIRHLVLDVCSPTGCSDVPVLLLRSPEETAGVGVIRQLRAGTLTISGRYRVRGQVVRLPEVRVRAHTNYPNGAGCDADGASVRIAIGTDGIRAA